MGEGPKLIDISELPASLPEIVDDIEAGTTSGVDITREGRVIAIIRSPRPSLHGALRGSVRVPDGYDLTAPVVHDTGYAERGRVHE
jgi:hypothetical protein